MSLPVDPLTDGTYTVRVRRVVVGVRVIEVHYGGQTYSIPDRTINDVQEQVAGIVASGQPGWLEVVDGYGSRAPYLLLITAGTPIALVQVPTG